MTRRNIFSILILFGLMALSIASARTDDFLATVVAKSASRNAELPGELQPFLSVSLHAKVSGYVEKILVDRGSSVKDGQLLVEISAPETQAHISEAESKVQAAEAERLQAEAQLAGLQSTYDRLKKAAETPGAIADNELVQLQTQIDTAQAVIQSRRQAGQAAEANVRALKELQSYLHVTAPFDGIVTERLIHPGALVGPGNAVPLLVIQQISKLRLVVAVPEEYAGTIPFGARVEFHVPAFPERSFAGTIARSAHALDPKTRTMAVELDVANSDGSLAPGMYATAQWPVRRSRLALMVPGTSVVTTSERTFVIRDRNGIAEWVDVKKGATEGSLVEVLGPLRSGDRIVRRATDEVREGSPLDTAAK
jgi:membrane fusion protein, multidrug efflux system